MLLLPQVSHNDFNFLSSSVIQKHLVFVVGLSNKLADADVRTCFDNPQEKEVKMLMLKFQVQNVLKFDITHFETTLFPVTFMMIHRKELILFHS